MSLWNILAATCDVCLSRISHDASTVDPSEVLIVRGDSYRSKG